MANIKRANASSITKSGVAIADVPDAPTIGAVADLADGTSASVAYTAAVTGGTATTFTATSTPGSLTGTGSSPITVTGLTAGTAYTFTVVASNTTGSSPASSASSSLTLAPGNAYASIATYTVSSTDTTLTFSSIPATYTHLQVRAFVQQTRATYGIGQLYYRFNADTGSNYAYHYMYGDGSTTTAGNGTSATYYMDNAGTYASNAGGTIVSIFGGGVTDILDYANTNKYKTMRSLSGVDLNGTVGGLGGRVGISSGLWMNTNAISSITILPSETNFRQYTTFALYGIKGV